MRVTVEWVAPQQVDDRDVLFQMQEPQMSAWLSYSLTALQFFFFFSITVTVWQISYTFGCDIHSRNDVKYEPNFVRTHYRRKISKDLFIIITQIKNAFVLSSAIRGIWNTFSLNHSDVFQDDKQKYTSVRIKPMALRVNTFKDKAIKSSVRS